MNAEALLNQIKKLDRDHWSQPSNSLAIKITELERQYEQMTGKTCPEWPKREIAA